MTTYYWEKNSGSGWVPFSGTPTVQNPSEVFTEGTWDIRATVSEGAQTGTKTRTGYITVTASAPAYTGPLDLVSGIDAAYSTGRALKASMLGQTIFSIKQIGGDGLTQPFAADAVTGIAPTAAVNTFLSGADDGAFKSIVDHTGNGNTLDAPGNSLLWDDNVIGNRPGISSSGSEVAEASSLSIAFSTGCTVIAVCSVGVQIIAGASRLDFNLVSGAGSAYVSLEDDGGDFAGTTVDDALPAGLHIYMASWRNGSRVFSIDGVEQANTDFDTGDINAFSLTSTAIFFNEVSKCGEWYIASPQLSASDINTVLLPNIQAFWGTPALP